jgi:hypothetical protein
MLNRERQERWRQRREERYAREAGRPRPSRCDLCHEERRIVYDHSHNTGRFRGWLCDRCNKVLGLVRDDVGLLGAMVAYLGRRDGETESSASEEA